MKLTAILLIGFFMQVSASGTAQNVTFKGKNVPLTAVFKAFHQQTGYNFLYTYELIEKAGNVDVNLNDVPLTTALNICLGGSSLTYSIMEGTVLIEQRPVSSFKELWEQMEELNRPITVEGLVTDAEGNPLEAVSILAKGTNIGTSTNKEGRYRLRFVQHDGILVFSSVGYITQEVAVEDRSTINITMNLSMVRQQEILIANTGYQTISKERSGGAITVIDKELLENKSVYSISNALEGLVAGMAKGRSMARGQDRFLIRGEGTLQTGQEEKDPLIVVDGFPIQGFSSLREGGDGLLNAKDPFSTINPNDIETITVLKDAAAASIYGARAANGVIVITTKKGKKSEKISVSANGFMSVDAMPDLAYQYNFASTDAVFKFLDILQQYDANFDATYYNPYLDPRNPFRYLNEPASIFKELQLGKISQAEFDSRKSELLSRDQTLWEKDLNKYIYRNATHKQYNVALRGGSEKMTYSLSTAYDTDKAYEQGNGSSRLIINLQNNFKLHRKLSLDIGANGNFSKNDNNAVTPNGVAPWWRLVDDNGEFIHSPVPSGSITMYYPILMDKYEGLTQASWLYNPVIDRDYMSNGSNKFGTRMNASLTYNVLKELTLSLKGQYEYARYSSRRVYQPESYYVRNYVNTYSQLNSSTGKYETYFPTGGVLTDNGDTYGGYNLRAQATYNKRFGKHDISVMAGTEVLSSTTEVDPSITRYGYNDITNAVISTVDYITLRPNIFGASARLPFSGLGGLITIENRFFSGYANASYTYDGKYSIYGSARTDASNFQASDIREKFSPFWSASAVWIMSKEDFMKKINWLSFLKLRFSAGESGIAAGKTGNSTVTTVSTASGSLIYNNNEGVNRISLRGNPTLTWEKSRNYDVGLEFGLWQGKLTGDLTFYDRYSYDVLAPASVPLITQGVTSSTFNNASISNKGVELTLGTHIDIAKDLRWRGNLTFSYNKNKLVDYRVLNTSPTPNYSVGYPLQPFWARNVVGYTPEGLFIMIGKDGTELIVTSRDETHLYDQINEAAGDKVDEYNWAVFVGTRTPNYNMGFVNNLKYKGLTLSFTLIGAFDYYFTKSYSFSSRLDDAAYSKNLEDALRVREEGYANQTEFTTNTIWTDANKDLLTGGSLGLYMGNLANASITNYHRADHIRLNEIHLGYTIPDNLLRGFGGFHGINVYAQAKNLGVIWTKNGKWDPTYPPGTWKPAQTYVIGLKFSLN